MHGILEINQINAIKEHNRDWLAKTNQPKSVFGPTGRPPAQQAQQAQQAPETK